jgi:hypothetical protein
MAHEYKASWVKLLLNGGVDPVTSATVISREALEEVTSAHSIVDRNPRGGPERSIVGYGLGWTDFPTLVTMYVPPRVFFIISPLASSNHVSSPLSLLSDHFARLLRDYNLIIASSYPQSSLPSSQMASGSSRWPTPTECNPR